MNILKNKERILVLALGLLIIFCIGCSNIKDEINMQSKTINQEYSTEIDNTSSETKFFQIIDNYDNDGYPSFEEFMNGTDIVNNLKQFHLNLKEDFKLKEFSFQPVQQLTYYDKDKIFIREGSRLNEKVVIEGEDRFVNTFYTITIDEYFSEQLSSKISEGRIFEKKDFVFQEENISIILGDSYRSYYTIGDVLNFNYLSENFKFEVVGFFSKDTKFVSGAKEYVLDKYICLPFFNLNLSDFSNRSEKFREIYYMSRTNGYIFANDNYEKLKSEIEAYAKTYGFFYTLTENEYLLGVR